MAGTSTHRAGGPPTGAERGFVLAGVPLAALFTIASIASGTGTEHLGAAWMAAIAWTVAASLAGALRRGLRHRDWSAFGRRELSDRDRQDEIDWSSRTGAYQWLHDCENRLLRDNDDYLGSHDRT